LIVNWCYKKKRMAKKRTVIIYIWCLKQSERSEDQKVV
jgi:hypothetical protein